MQITPQVLYRDLKNVCKKLMGRIIEIDNGREGWDIFNIITRAVYKDKEGLITLTINKQAEPYLLQLKELFTTFKLENALTMDGKYAIRVYQQAKSNTYKGEYIMKIDDFKKKLKLTQKSYKEYSNIKTKVIQPAIKEINEKTDINLTVEEIKVGRKVEALKFITSNKQKVRVTNKNPRQAKSKGNGFNNFEGRNYTKEEYDNIENKLLGWE